jgi:shikimate kinase
MGCGKSTVGPLLAQHIGYEFIDLDQVIENASGVPIRQIFSERGEEEFRRLESLMLRAVSRAARVIIALGGGAVVSENNLYFVLTNGTLVYLNVEPVVLVRRIMNMADERPLLLRENGSRLSEDELVQRVEEMIEAREHFYRRAEIVIEVGDKSVDATVDATVDALSVLS